MGAPYHGKNALIYIDGNELAGGNAWSISTTLETAEASQFNDTWKQKTKGLLDWSGNITSFDQGDENVIYDAATASDSVVLLIYPYRSVAGNFYSGNAIFSFNSDGSMSSSVSVSADFEGDGTLSATGFA